MYSLSLTAPFCVFDHSHAMGAKGAGLAGPPAVQVCFLDAPQQGLLSAGKLGWGRGSAWGVARSPPLSLVAALECKGLDGDPPLESWSIVGLQGVLPQTPSQHPGTQAVLRVARALGREGAEC